MTTFSTSQSYTVRGMDCAGCARAIESGIAQLEGVDSCDLSFSTETLHVRGSASREAVEERIRALGYTVADPEDAGIRPQFPPPSFLRFMLARGETRLALLGAILLLPGLVFHEVLRWEADWIEWPALAALFLAGMPVVRSAWRTITVGRELSIQVLMTIAVVGAVLIDAYVEAGMVVVLFAIGEALEGYTSQRARHAVRGLMNVAPETATRLRADGDHAHEETVQVDDLRAGDLLLIRPGERLAMDGRVRTGRSAVNQAPITGESMPVETYPGADVFAGTINGEGVLEVEVTRPAEESTVRRMIRLVEEAQVRRAPTQRFVDRFARVYTPAVVLLAVLVAAVPPLVFGAPFWNPDAETSGWLYRALALLVVACPCALVLSTPVTIISALSAAARGGVLIKGGAYLEALGKVRAVALDKTGTLTAGRPAVVAVRAAMCREPELAAVGHCIECDEVLAVAHTVERRSEHPLARAVVRASRERGLAERYPAAREVTAVAGRGVTGILGGRTVTIGSHAYFDAHFPHGEDHCGRAARDAELGHTPVLVGADGAYLGTITIADAVRSTSRTAVAELAGLGLPVAMLTGDHAAAARTVGEQLGIEEIFAELLPEHKLQVVEALERRYGPVAMVGDGINDTPALARAAVGVAIGGTHGGTHQAMETADVTLMSDDLRRLPFAVRLARSAMRTVGANVIFSIGIKLAFMILVLVGAGTMWMAVLADVGASLLVTLNGMRLLRYGGVGRTPPIAV